MHEIVALIGYWTREIVAASVIFLMTVTFLGVFRSFATRGIVDTIKILFSMNNNS